MSTIMDETGTRLARRIRLEREGRGWSLAEVAERSGVAKATLSKIEREEMSPTAALLVRLAGAFDLTLAGLLLRAEGGGDRLVRSSEQPRWRDPESGYLRRQVFMRPDHPLEAVQVELPPGARVSLPASSYLHIRQVIWVQAGTLTVQEGLEHHELLEGDALGFGPPAEVVLSNDTEASCTYLVMLARG